MPRRNEDLRQDLNLAPIMNIVVILIPLLLLAVVFISVGVVNVSTPLVTPDGSQTEKTPDEELRLTVAISRDGFVVSSSEGVHARVPLAEDGDLGDAFDRARRGDETGVDDALGAYDFPALYSEMVEIKEQHPDETKVNMSADADVPYVVVVRAMDTVRTRLDKDRYETKTEFWSASKSKRDGALFPDPVLAVVR